MATKDYKDMFAAAVHVGHRVQKWNPKMKKYIYGKQNGVHVINLEYTLEMLNTALEFLNKIVAEGKIVLFVSTKPQSVKIVEQSAKNCKMPYVISKWLPGLLTNFSTIKNRIRYFKSLKDQESSGEFEKYTKKEAAEFRKDIDKLETALGGVQDLVDTPDAVFVVDVVRDVTVVKEAKKIGIPVIALVDTNADPMMVDYPIPANDDSIKSLRWILGKLEEVIGKSSK